MSIKAVVRGSLWLYLGALSSQFLGYIYWLIASSLVGPSVLGTAAAIIGLETVIALLVSLGIPSGLQRFIGMAKGQRDSEGLASYFWNALLFKLMGDIGASLFLLWSSLQGISILGLKGFQLLLVALLLLIGAGSWPLVLNSLLWALLKTHVTALAQNLYSIFRLVVGVPLLVLGWGLVGFMMGLFVGLIIMDLLLLAYALNKVKELRTRLALEPSRLLELSKAGLAVWIPGSLMVMGQWMGVLGLYQVAGGSEAGFYFIAFAISRVAFLLPFSLLSLMFPVLSGMNQGQVPAILKAMRLSMLSSFPLCILLALYPQAPLSLLGPSYLNAALPLRILALGIMASPLFLGYASYIYATGRYLHVALVGLASDGSRLVLYAALLTSMGQVGAALAYSLGFLLALLASSLSSKRIGFPFPWTLALKALAIPGALGLSLFSSGLPWALSIVLLPLGSAIAYSRLGMIKKEEIKEVLEAILSEDRASRLYRHARPIGRLLFGNETD